MATAVDRTPRRTREEQSGWTLADMDASAGFLVLGGPLADDHRVVHVVEADSRTPSAPGSPLTRGAAAISSHSIDSWTIRLVSGQA
jgi:hypothetical protein